MSIRLKNEMPFRHEPAVPYKGQESLPFMKVTATATTKIQHHHVF
jgi:hypothetical protein